ncbi:MAG: quinone oxidoreductase family protein [Burkholderiales bacterium]
MAKPMAQVIHKKGGPENFSWEPINVGKPAAGEVRLNSLAIGVNFADTYHRRGIPHPLVVGDPPVIVGLEGVATVVELGADVTEFSTGDKVCYTTPPIGAYAEERVFPADKLIKVPDDIGITDAELASILLKGLTAQYLLRETYVVKPGDFVLIHAAAGGMGHVLCPWARHLGATVIGTVSTEEKARVARDLGCHHTINYSKGDFVDEVRAISGGEGVHVVYESIGKTTLRQSLKCLRLRGMCAAYGHASGIPEPVDIVTELGVPGSLFITRPAIWHYLTPRSAMLNAAQAFFDAIKAGVVKATIARTFALSEAGDAHRFIEARKTIGSIVLLP